MKPPPIRVMKPSALPMENTMARSAAVSVTPLRALRCSAMGAANTLQAYMEPMHRLIRQLAIRMIQRFFVSLSCSCSVIG